LTAADRLDLWLEDGDLRYHWQAMEKPDPVFRLTNLATASAGEKPSPRNQDDPPTKLMERVLAHIDRGEQRLPDVEPVPGNSICMEQTILMPFEVDVHNQGVLQLSGPELDTSNAPKVESYEDLAQLLGVAISNRRARAALMERVKELDCMYRIAHIAAEPNVGLDDMLQQIAGLLPVALQYPGLATARITLGQNSFCSAGFEPGPYRLSADVIGRGEMRGQVEVFYRETGTHTFDDIQLLAEEPFLAEERHLIVGVARELNSIIEHKQAEEETLPLQTQVRRADRLVTIGQLAAGVAHELNEPLGNILGFAQLANKSPNLSEQTRSDIEKIEKASLYAREIIRKLMLFSRQAPARKVDVDLRNVIEDSLSLLKARCDTAGIKVAMELGSELGLIQGDPSQLQQVIVNLAVNAIQAMPAGGTLTIKTLLEPNSQCMIVEDTGSGIAPGDIKNVFLPFFTTKEVGEGTGLGLSVVHGIVTSHGGSVHVESKVDSGTRFKVRLPAQVNERIKSNDDEE